MRYLYTLLFYAAAPWLVVRLLWKSRGQPAYRERLGERFGFYVEPPAGRVIWFHAVSVGECEAAFPIIRALWDRHPGLPVLVTCTTPTGSARVRAVLGDQVRHVYLPYDLPDAIRRFLDHYQPRLGVILETEIWPNLFAACRQRGLPLTIVNGRLSDASAKGYARMERLTEASLAAVRQIAAQTAADAERYRLAGARPGSVQVTGNVKFDIRFDAGQQAYATRLRATLFPGRPVLIAGSTHQGEEELVLEALASIRQTAPKLLLVLAPRHPQRAAQIRAVCERQGYAVRNRSEGAACDPDTAVLLIDGIGELRAFYGAADVAFIGGSLVPHGGQNVLEAAVTGIPVLFGPYTMNFREITDRLIEAGGGVRVEDSAALAATVIRLLKEPALASRLGQQAQAFVTANGGAVGRVVGLLDELLQEYP